MLFDKPALKIALPFIVGILLGKFFQIHIPLLILSILILLIILLIIKMFVRKDIYIFGFYLLLILLGLFKFQMDYFYKEDDRIDRFVNPNQIVILKGKIIDPPVRKLKYVQFVVESESLFTKYGGFKTSGNVIIYCPQENVVNISRYNYGQLIKVKSLLESLSSARNPGDFDVKKYLNSNDIYAKMYVEQEENIFVLKSENYFSIIDLIYSVRSNIAQNVETNISGLEAGFLKGILIGDRSEIPLELKESFINSGVMHILAVSGLHVGIIILIILSILNVFNLPEKIRFILTALFLLFYIYLTGNSPSVTRASIMAIALMGTVVVQRKINVYNSLAVAALIILIIDSRQLFHPGFQLSFAAVVSIVALYPKISKIVNILPEKIREYNSIKYIVALFSVSFSAAVGTLPFTSFYFGKISIIGLLANLFIVPLMGIVLAMGFIFTIFSFISSSISSLVAETVRLLSSVLLISVDYFGNWKYSHIDANISIYEGIIYYLFVFVIFSINKNNFINRLIIIVLLFLNIYVYEFLFRKDTLRVIFIDVGQGDAIFIKTPEEKFILIDAGMKNIYQDAGERFILPFLKRNGIDKIDLIINTHPHSDHLGGIPSILRKVKVDRVIDSGSSEESEVYEDYRHLIDSLEIKYTNKYYNDTIDVSKKIRMYVLHPYRDIIETRNKNNHSLVIKLIFGKNSILLTGDVEKEYEKIIARRYFDFIKSEILKCAHHGSNTSNSEEFINLVQPEYAVISVGLNNKFDHPSEEVLELLNEKKIKICRTDLDGAVVFETDGLKLRKINWRE